MGILSVIARSAFARVGREHEYEAQAAAAFETMIGTLSRDSQVSLLEMERRAFIRSYDRTTKAMLKLNASAKTVADLIDSLDVVLKHARDMSRIEKYGTDFADQNGQAVGGFAAFMDSLIVGSCAIRPPADAPLLIQKFRSFMREIKETQLVRAIKALSAHWSAHSSNDPNIREIVKIVVES